MRALLFTVALAGIVAGGAKDPVLGRHFWSVLEKETEACSVDNAQSAINITPGNKYNTCTVHDILINQLSLDYPASCVSRKSCRREDNLGPNDGLRRAALANIFGNVSGRYSLLIFCQCHNIWTQVSENINSGFSPRVMILDGNGPRIADLRQSVRKASGQGSDPSPTFFSHLFQLIVEDPPLPKSQERSNENPSNRQLLSRSAAALASLLLALVSFKLVCYGVDVSGDREWTPPLIIGIAFMIFLLAGTVLFFFALDLPALHPQGTMG